MSRDHSDIGYHSFSKFFHWVIAGLIFSSLLMGFTMVCLDFSPTKLSIYTLHKSFGMTILFLAGLRILWRSFSSPPPALSSHKMWEKVLSKFIHLLLYVGMIGMPISGWLMSSAGDFSNSYFWLFEFPQLMEKDEAWFAVLKDAHEYAALALMSGVALHMAGALKHHFIDRDITMKRMTSLRLGYIGASLLVFCGFSVLGVSAFLYVKSEEWLEQPSILNSDNVEEIASVDITPVYDTQPDNAWAIMHDKSYIHFTAKQYGSPFDGRFERFGGDIIFDPKNLDQALVDIKIDVTSLKTGASDRDVQALDKPWFFVDEYRYARFSAEEFIQDEQGRYVAQGRLSIRDVKRDLDLPFSLKIDENDDGERSAIMDASFTLDRTQFNIGQGEWASDSTIDHDVNVRIHLEVVR